MSGFENIEQLEKLLASAEETLKEWAELKKAMIRIAEISAEAPEIYVEHYNEHRQRELARDVHNLNSQMMKIVDVVREVL